MNEVTCPDCGTRLRLGQVEVGGIIVCPACGAVLEILQDFPLLVQLVFDADAADLIDSPWSGPLIDFLSEDLPDGG